MKNFKEYGLDLTFRETSTADTNTQVEFLDVLHVVRKNEPKGFIIQGFIKPTARNATFLNGRSYHPRHVFTGTIVGEARRLRRLNEKDSDYLASLKRLEQKSIKSNFNEEIGPKILSKISSLSYFKRLLLFFPILFTD